MKDIHTPQVTSTQRMQNFLELALFCLIEEKRNELQMEIKKLLLETEQFTPSGDETTRAQAGTAPRMRELLELTLAEKPATIHMDLTHDKIKEFLQEEEQ